MKRRRPPGTGWQPIGSVQQTGNQPESAHRRASHGFVTLFERTYSQTGFKLVGLARKKGQTSMLLTRRKQTGLSPLRLALALGVVPRGRPALIQGGGGRCRHRAGRAGSQGQDPIMCLSCRTPRRVAGEMGRATGIAEKLAFLEKGKWRSSSGDRPWPRRHPCRTNIPRGRRGAARRVCAKLSLNSLHT